MWKFEEIGNQIKEKCKYKISERGSIYAVRCKSQYDFELMRSYYVDAYTSCHSFYPVEIKGEYTGEDWYFIEKCEIDRGMEGHETKYWFETLSQKKAKFEKFLAEYESEEDEKHNTNRS